MSTEEPIKRGPGRPRIHPAEPPAERPDTQGDDPRVRAAARAALLREHLGESLTEDEDKFYIDPRVIPDGWSYEWKRLETLNKPDPSYQVALAHRGWEPVPRSRHPQMMPDSDQGNSIIRDGMILMERPKEITDEVKKHDYRRAIEQVRGKEQQLGAAPPGTFERDNKGSSLSKVRRSYESVPIPDK